MDTQDHGQAWLISETPKVTGQTTVKKALKGGQVALALMHQASFLTPLVEMTDFRSSLALAGLPLSALTSHPKCRRGLGLPR